MIINVLLMRVPVLSEGVVDTITVPSQQLQMLLEMQSLPQENEGHREYGANESKKATVHNFLLAFKN